MGSADKRRRRRAAYAMLIQGGGTLNLVRVAWASGHRPQGSNGGHLGRPSTEHVHSARGAEAPILQSFSNTQRFQIPGPHVLAAPYVLPLGIFEDDGTSTHDEQAVPLPFLVLLLRCLAPGRGGCGSKSYEMNISGARQGYSQQHIAITATATATIFATGQPEQQERRQREKNINRSNNSKGPTAKKSSRVGAIIWSFAAAAAAVASGRCGRIGCV